MLYHPFVYELPRERIAQRPVYPYHEAKLLYLGVESTGEVLIDSTFSELPFFLKEGDLLVFNNSQVMSSRLFGTYARGEAELLLLKQDERHSGCWQALARPLKKIIAEGSTVSIGTDGVVAEILSRIDDRRVLVRLHRDDQLLTRDEVLRLGNMPIPPYIREGRADSQDKEDYQTWFSSELGSAAAPTASLHFTQELCTRLHDVGVLSRFVTLHVGAASFLPLFDTNEATDIQQISKPGKEKLEVSANLIEECLVIKSRGNKVVAVGTTVARALESAVRGTASGETDLFITPEHRFEVITHLVTNFHQPGTTHLLIVEAIIGKKRLSRMYQHALEKAYRFLSYGDGMFIPVLEE